MREERVIPDLAVAEICARQHGVITYAQLLAAGVGRSGVARRKRAGRLHQVHRGVYAVGNPVLSFEGRCLAAVLACGDGAAASHRTAAAVWRMLVPSTGHVHVSVCSPGGRRRRPGMVIHRPPSLTPMEVTRRSGIPVTRPARTLRDLRRIVPVEVHRRAVRRALDLGLICDQDLGADPDLTRSELERMFLRLCRRWRLPTPEVNARVHAFEVDFLWRSARVVVETDGFRHHGDRGAFERDRARDATLQAVGYRVVRFTYRQVRDEPAVVAGRLREILDQR